MLARWCEPQVRQIRPACLRSNRGTEYVKSPEMLLVGNAARRDRAAFDRRRREGAGPPADAWAAGCLLFELLARQLLFQDADWIRFFMRVTQPGQVRPCQ